MASRTLLFSLSLFAVTASGCGALLSLDDFTDANTTGTGGGTATSVTGTSASTTSSGGGQGGGAECTTPTDCPGEDTDCQNRTCEGGACGTHHAPLGTPCNEDGGEVCDGEGACVLAACANGRLDPGETDVDCGGTECGPCDDGEDCLGNDDCVSMVCLNNVCAAPQCDDFTKNQDETDVDCGGDVCGPCKAGDTCLQPDDCESQICENSVCLDPDCFDSIKNGNETDVDCGGNMCPQCGPNQMCGGHGDCQGAWCYNGMCAPTCVDGVANNGEPTADCGGPCFPCPNGATCSVPADCMSSVCYPGVFDCEAPTCGDGVKNQGEADADCSGPCAAKCAPGRSCGDNSDCAAGVCFLPNGMAPGVCLSPSCFDSVKNGNEAGIDCGGGCTKKCAPGTPCLFNADCHSLTCDGSLQCAASSCTDGTKNGTESDVDCGGPACVKCPSTKTCVGNADCIGNQCSAGLCVPNCSDKEKNNGETDIDCGGGTCAPCPAGRSCVNAGSCASGSCVDSVCCDSNCFGTCMACSQVTKLRGLDGVCDFVHGNTDPGNECFQAFSCNGTGACQTCLDGIENGDETDVDCGGSSCPLCTVGKSCNTNNDCNSGSCGGPPAPHRICLF